MRNKKRLIARRPARAKTLRVQGGGRVIRSFCQVFYLHFCKYFYVQNCRLVINCVPFV